MGCALPAAFLPKPCFFEVAQAVTQQIGHSQHLIYNLKI